MPQLLFPSVLAQQQCSTAASMAGFGIGDRYQDLALPYGTTM
jgi:aminoglycoside phosphotransferase